ncbi:MAG TPA: beta-propeller fold lactonase family protein [Flavipsychrobacter sp.]|nr:beta-propeller fold lactonase family protein [Flavipsychrobacter sp.]
MKKTLLLLCYSFFPLLLFAQTDWKKVGDSLAEHRIILPNGWALTPVGCSLPLGDLPLNIAVSPSGKYVAVTNNGVSEQTIQLIDVKKEKVLCNTVIPASWLGLKFSSDEHYVYASEGNANSIFKYEIKNDSLILADSIVLGRKWPEKISPAGIDLYKDRMYVVTKENNSLYVIDLASKKIIKQVPLGAEAYTCLLSPDHKLLYISLWGGDKILIYDTKDQTIADSIKVGRNPNDICFTKNGKYLFVANAVDNSVSVIDLEKRKVIETLNAALYPNAPDGSTTNSVTLSANDKTLYIANADNNCLAVFDVSTPGNCHSKGFIPVGWYPTCVRTVGHKILVANGKGFTSLPNPKGPQPVSKNNETTYKKASKKRSDQYIGSLFKGTLSIFNEPDLTALGVYSKLVYENTPYTKEKETQSQGEPGNPIPMKVGDPSPIKHVFYIIKENRTYDQVLGDIAKGNGDTSLVLFGSKITPNEHAIADQFVLLDNFYVDAEVSADGHNWSMAAYANDFVEKTWPTNYGGRGGNYDFGGNRAIAFPRSGFIWDYALRADISVRNYGEFADDGKVPLADLDKHTCRTYPGWNLAIQDVAREQIWEKDFDSLVANNAVPQLSIIYFPNDHTSGLSKGAYTPFAHVADNDQAVGEFLEHLSQSAIWKDAAIFVLEDDAQNGPDHVDAHRSIAFVAGPYVKRNFTDHTAYSTTGMLRTMELILGLPAMSQYDAAAVPMWRSFTSTLDFASYQHIDAQIDINERNVAVNTLSRQSATFDLSKADDVPDKALNDVLWKSIKGINSTPPSPKRAAFLAVHKKKD